MLPELTKSITKTFEIEVKTGEQPDVHFQQREELESFLTEKVSDMLDHEFEKLMNILYRIDVGETKIAAILSNPSVADKARLIARLAIERQLQKIETRKKYQDPDGGDLQWV